MELVHGSLRTANYTHLQFLQVFGAKNASLKSNICINVLDYSKSSTDHLYFFNFTNLETCQRLVTTGKLIRSNSAKFSWCVGSLLIPEGFWNLHVNWWFQENCFSVPPWVESLVRNSLTTLVFMKFYWHFDLLFVF